IAGVTVTPGGGGAGFSAFEEQPMQIISATISTPKACSCLVAACGEIVDIIEKMPPNRTSFLCILHTPRGANTGFPEGEIVSTWATCVEALFWSTKSSLRDDASSQLESGELSKLAGP